MTDNDIIKALEVCTFSDCRKCPYYTTEYKRFGRCTEKNAEDLIALINRQKAEIEALKLINSTYVATTNEIREIAIKEFAERLKGNMAYKWAWNTTTFDGTNAAMADIDHLVKEMERERE